MRETTEKGDRLTDVIEHGISRIKHASDCLAVLLKELKEHAKEGGCRVFCAVDLVNAFYRPTNLRREDLTGIQVDHFTIGRAFKKLFRNDWVCLADWRLVPFTLASNFFRFLQTNGAVVVAVGTKPYLRKYKTTDKWIWKGIPSHPKHLLAEEVRSFLSSFSRKSASTAFSPDSVGIL